MSEQRRPDEKWMRRVDDSGLVLQIDQATSELETLQIEGASELADVERIRSVLGYIRGRLDAADQVLVSEAALIEIANLVSALRQNADQVRSTGNVGYLNNAMGHVDAMLAATSRIPSPVTLEDAAVSLKAFKSSVAGSKSQALRQLDELRMELAAAQARLREFEASTSAELGRLGQTVSTAVTQIQATQESQRVAFDEAQASRSVLWDQQTARAKSTLDDQLAAAQVRVEEQAAAAAQSIASATELAEAGNDRINKILGIVGDKGLVGQFNLTASRERRSMRVWRGATTVVALVAIAVAFSASRHPLADDGASWRPLITKLALTAVIAGLAVYCGSVANDHRRGEQTAERTALQLAALKPYLNDIEDSDVRDTIMMVTASRIFGIVNADDVGNVTGPSLGGLAKSQLSEELLGLVRRLTSDAKG